MLTMAVIVSVAMSCAMMVMMLSGAKSVGLLGIAVAANIAVMMNVTMDVIMVPKIVITSPYSMFLNIFGSL